MKVVINCRYGGFGLSEAAKKDLPHLKEVFNFEPEYRMDSKLIALIEEKGSKYVSGHHAALVIVEIPNKFKHWEIEEYDGYERIVASESPMFKFHGVHISGGTK